MTNESTSKFCRKIGDQFKAADIENLKYKLTWEGTSAGWEIYKILDADDMLEFIFDKFNLNRRSKGFPDIERAMSIGDIVSIDYQFNL